MKRRIISSLLCLCALGLSSCNETKFSEDWSSNALMHWHASSDGESGLAKDLAPHNFGNDNVCDDCGYLKPTKFYNFNFVSDFCDLDNESSYEEGKEVELTITPRDGNSKPQTIEVYINGNVANEQDYTFNKESGKLTLTVTGDILVRVMSDNNPAKYQISEDNLTNALNFSNKAYVQLDSSYGLYSDYSLNYTSRLIECGEDVVHASMYNLYASRSSASYSYSEQYIKKINEDYECYRYDADGWEKLEYEAISSEYNSARANMARFAYIGDFVITFDKLNGHFDDLTYSYNFEFSTTKNDKTTNWKMRISFFDSKLTSVNYYSEDSYSYFGYYTYTYNQITPAIPQEALNAGQVE